MDLNSKLPDGEPDRSQIPRQPRIRHGRGLGKKSRIVAGDPQFLNECITLGKKSLHFLKVTTP